jgi:hypothetical protein
MNKLPDLTIFLLPVFLIWLTSAPLQAAAEDDFGGFFSIQAERKKLYILRQNQ